MEVAAVDPDSLQFPTEQAVEWCIARVKGITCVCPHSSWNDQRPFIMLSAGVSRRCFLAALRPEFKPEHQQPWVHLSFKLMGLFIGWAYNLLVSRF